MYIGLGIVLLILGAVIVFAYDGDMNIVGLDVHTIGWILIAAGILSIVLSFIVMSGNRRPRRTVTERRSGVDPATGEHYDEVDSRNGF